MTIVLGANDHGKSNLLNAMLHLNPDKPFDPQRDLNWDLTKQAPDFPRVAFTLKLTPDEKKLLEEADEKRRAGTKPAETQPEGAAAQVVAELPIAVPETVVLTRYGCAKELTWPDVGSLPAKAVAKALLPRLPRVELIKPYDSIPDDVTAPELSKESMDFMRGIFYYAGLDPKDPQLFVQSDETERSLEEASKELDSTLKRTWTQGSNLKFVLRHFSQSQSIGLRIDDPSVHKQRVRASQRSSGFTHYFAMKTILFARQREHRATSYLFLFDEPGVYLHPFGQSDLLHVLEALGAENQVIYSTHSMFMINKTYPTRHRLVLKDADGTKLDGKPYVSRWGPVIDHLGMSLTGTFLFAKHVLLSEGDSDPVLIQAMLQRLVAMSKIVVDLNSLCILATSESKNAEVQIDLLLESAIKPSLAVLVDGDDGGKQRLKDLQLILKRRDIPAKQLSDAVTIEDLLLGGPRLYATAAIQYAKKLAVIHSKKKPDVVEQEMEASFERYHSSKSKAVGIVSWAQSAIAEVVEVKEASKIGLAREYVNLLVETPDDQIAEAGSTAAEALGQWIVNNLKIGPPSQVEKLAIGRDSGVRD